LISSCSRQTLVPWFGKYDNLTCRARITALHREIMIFSFGRSNYYVHTPTLTFCIPPLKKFSCAIPVTLSFSLIAPRKRNSRARLPSSSHIKRHIRRQLRLLCTQFARTACISLGNLSFISSAQSILPCQNEKRVNSPQSVSSKHQSATSTPYSLSSHSAAPSQK
jgi:hypothetical protein